MKLKHSSQQILLQLILKFHIILLKFSIFTNKNFQSDTFFPKLKNTMVKIDIKSFSVQYWNFGFFQKHKKFSYFHNFGWMWLVNELFLKFSAPIMYVKAHKFNLIIEYTTQRQADRRTDTCVQTVFSVSKNVKI